MWKYKKLNKTPRPDWQVQALESRFMATCNAAPVPEVELASAQDTASTVETHATPSHEVIFVDERAMDSKDLQNALVRDADVVVVSANRDGISQISEYIAANAGLRAIHLVSHAQAGELQLGNCVISRSKLESRRDELTSWKKSLAPDADLLIYGCSFASSQNGRSILEGIHRWTGLDIAASTDLTGGHTDAANWTLEYQLGTIDTSIPLNEAFKQSFEGHLLIEVRAAGSTGDEELQLEVNNEVVATWTLTGTDSASNQFQAYSFNVEASDINQVRVRFLNDAYNPDVKYDEMYYWIRLHLMVSPIRPMPTTFSFLVLISTAQGLAAGICNPNAYPRMAFGNSIAREQKLAHSFN